MFETRPPQLRHWRDHHENPPTDSCCIRRRVPYASRVRRHHGEQPRRLHGVAEKFDKQVTTHATTSATTSKAKDMRAQGEKLCKEGKTSEGTKKLHEALKELNGKAY